MLRFALYRRLLRLRGARTFVKSSRRGGRPSYAAIRGSQAHVRQATSALHAEGWNEER